MIRRVTNLEKLSKRFYDALNQMIIEVNRLKKTKRYRERDLKNRIESILQSLNTRSVK